MTPDQQGSSPLGCFVMLVGLPLVLGAVAYGAVVVMTAVDTLVDWWRGWWRG